jgi:hypothetical protein
MKYRDESYFKPNTLYLIDNGCRYVLAKAELYNNQYWFTYPGMHIKSITTRCIELSELAGRIATHIKYDQIKGTIMGHTGITNTPYLYIYWHKPIPFPLPLPCALPNINDFHF